MVGCLCVLLMSSFCSLTHWIFGCQSTSFPWLTDWLIDWFLAGASLCVLCRARERDVCAYGVAVQRRPWFQVAGPGGEGAQRQQHYVSLLSVISLCTELSPLCCRNFTATRSNNIFGYLGIRWCSGDVEHAEIWTSILDCARVCMLHTHAANRFSFSKKVIIL